MKTKYVAFFLTYILLGFHREALASDCLGVGFLPENDLKIPVTSFWLNGMTEAKFNQIIDKAVTFYTPVISAKGGKLVVNRLWSDATVNASAERKGQDWVVNMYGGLARHEAITEDGFLLIVCHELGHHLGGAPKYPGQWAANEGESDYFANLKCLKHIFIKEDNSAIIKTMSVDQVAVVECEKSYPLEKEKALCVRAAMAGQSSANLSGALGGTAKPTFGTPDASQVAQTKDSHPAAQCRLDTYLAGSVCDVAPSIDVSETDPTIGTCSEEKGQKRGVRPRCWYKPGGGGGGGGGIAKNPTVRGQTSAVETNPNASIPVDYDVSEFPGAAGAFLEFSGQNLPFSEPNGTLPDPKRTFRANQGGVRGTIFVTPMRHLPGWGVYGFRVIALDSSGAKAVSKFSNASTLTLRR